MAWLGTNSKDIALNPTPLALGGASCFQKVFKVKVFRVKVFRVKVFRASAFQGVCGQGAYGSGPGPFEALWQLQFGFEKAFLHPNLDLELLGSSGNYTKVFRVKVFRVKVFRVSLLSKVFAVKVPTVLDLGLLKPYGLGLLELSGNSNLVAKWPFWFQIWTIGARAI